MSDTPSPPRHDFLAEYIREQTAEDQEKAEFDAAFKTRVTEPARRLRPEWDAAWSSLAHLLRPVWAAIRHEPCDDPIPDPHQLASALRMVFDVISRFDQIVVNRREMGSLWYRAISNRYGIPVRPTDRLALVRDCRSFAGPAPRAAAELLLRAGTDSIEGLEQRVRTLLSHEIPRVAFGWLLFFRDCMWNPPVERWPGPVQPLPNREDPVGAGPRVADSRLQINARDYLRIEALLAGEISSNFLDLFPGWETERLRPATVDRMGATVPSPIPCVSPGETQANRCDEESSTMTLVLLPTPVRNWLTAKYLADPTPESFPFPSGPEPVVLVRFEEFAEFVGSAGYDLLPNLDGWRYSGWFDDITVELSLSADPAATPSYAIARLNLPTGRHRLVAIRRAVLNAPAEEGRTVVHPQSVDGLVSGIYTDRPTGLDTELAEAFSAVAAGVRECTRLIGSIPCLWTNEGEYCRLAACVSDAVKSARAAYQAVDIRLRRAGGPNPMLDTLNDVLTVQSRAPLDPTVTPGGLNAILTNLFTKRAGLFPRVDGRRCIDRMLDQLARVPPLTGGVTLPTPAEGVHPDSTPGTEVAVQQQPSPEAWTTIGDAKRAVMLVLQEAKTALKGSEVAKRAGYKYGSLRHHFGELQVWKYVERTKDGYAITSVGRLQIPCEPV